MSTIVIYEVQRGHSFHLTHLTGGISEASLVQMLQKYQGDAFEEPMNFAWKHQVVVVTMMHAFLVACDHVVEQCQNRWSRIN